MMQGQPGEEAWGLETQMFALRMSGLAVLGVKGEENVTRMCHCIARKKYKGF